nr:MAG TPA: hypothetical protein [Caudoviricetes sp.]
MKFCDIMLLCGVLCFINAICLAICYVIPGWVVCKCLFVGGSNCLALAVLTYN